MPSNPTKQPEQNTTNNTNLTSKNKGFGLDFLKDSSVRMNLFFLLTSIGAIIGAVYWSSNEVASIKTDIVRVQEAQKAVSSNYSMFEKVIKEDMGAFDNQLTVLKEEFTNFRVTHATTQTDLSYIKREVRNIKNNTNN